MHISFDSNILCETLTSMFRNALKTMPAVALADARKHLDCELESMLPITDKTSVLELVMLNYYLASQMTGDIDPIKLAGAKVYNKHLENIFPQQHRADFLAAFIEPTKKALANEQDVDELLAGLTETVETLRHNNLKGSQ